MRLCNTVELKTRILRLLTRACHWRHLLLSLSLVLTLLHQLKRLREYCKGVGL